MKDSKVIALEKRQRRVRISVVGTNDKPRLNVYRSNRHIYAQIINDEEAATIVAASDFELGDGEKKKPPKDIAKEVGKLIADKAKKKKVSEVVFDRGGRLYHGRVKSFADGARDGGLKF